MASWLKMVLSLVSIAIMDSGGNRSDPLALPPLEQGQGCRREGLGVAPPPAERNRGLPLTRLAAHPH